MAVDEIFMSYDHIAECATAYTEAVRRAEQGHDVRLADDVIRGRVALANCLLRAGWTPCRDVMARLVLDQELLVVPVGSFERAASLQHLVPVRRPG